MNTFRFHSRFENNIVVILDCLRSSDLQTARRLYEDMGHFGKPERPMRVAYYKIRDRAALRAKLSEIRHRCILGLRPILHLEGHGDPDKGFFVGDQEEVIKWDELNRRFLRINIKTKNNLGVVLAACHGLNSITSVSLFERCPYYFLVGTEEAVEAGFVDERMRSFYRSFAETENLSIALKQGAPHFDSLFHSEKVFCLAFAAYLRNHCVGKAAQKRLEDIITRLRETGIPPSAALAKARREVRQIIKHPAKKYDEYASWFLHGRQTASFRDIYRFVRADIEKTMLDIDVHPD